MMEQTLVDTVALGASAAPELSFLSLVLNAGWVVKMVMLLLLAASLWTWAVIFEKTLRMRKLNRQAGYFEDAFWSGRPLEEVFDRLGTAPAEPMSAIFAAGMREWRRGTKRGHPPFGSLAARVDRVMQVTLAREMEQLERRLPFLASVGSAAPFIGLFGTVWGIMNSFFGIAASKQTSLAVVAPGIAEALLATALGLAAAIPATIAYNKIAADMNRYGGRLDNFIQEFSAIVSRQLDERG